MLVLQGCGLICTEGMYLAWIPHLCTVSEFWFLCLLTSAKFLEYGGSSLYVSLVAITRGYGPEYFKPVPKYEFLAPVPIIFPKKTKIVQPQVNLT